MSNEFHAGDEFTGTQWGRLAVYPPVGTVVRVRTERGAVDGDSIEVGCKRFRIEALVGTRKGQISHNEDGYVAAEAEFTLGERGCLTTIGAGAGEERLTAAADVAQYASKVAIVSVPPQDIYLRLPTGIYQCFSKEHNHMLYLIPDPANASKGRWLTARLDATFAQAGGTVLNRECVPQLVTSFHRILRDRSSNYSPVEVTVPADQQARLSDALSLARLRS